MVAGGLLKVLSSILCAASMNMIGRKVENTRESDYVESGSCWDE